MTPTPSTGDVPDKRSLPVGRRGFLAGVAAVATVGPAGCSAIVDGLAERALGDVNLFNETDRPLAGSVEIAGPNGGTVLDESFGLEAQNEDDANTDATAVYEDVWSTTGDHGISVALDGGVEVRGESSATETVAIDDPDEQMLAVAFGAPDREAGIYVAIGGSWSEWH